MDNIEYAIAYSEVLEILQHISKEDYNKIPSEKIKMFKENSSKNYNFKYNSNLTLNEQNVSKRARAIIAILFRDYWATSSQREKINRMEKFNRLKIEKEKSQMYNPDSLFLNKESKVETVENSRAIVEYKKTIFIKIINWFKRTF